MTKVITIQGGNLVEVTSAQQVDQDRPSNEWTINHQLGKFPSVTVVDSAGRIIEGDVSYVSSSQIIVRFDFAFSGTAYLN